MTPEVSVSQRDAALQLMENALRDGRALAPEYPLVFGEGANATVETVEVDGRVVSTCAWLRRDLVTPTGTLPVALVGSVATEQSARGKGFGSRVVDIAVEHASEAGAALCLLWADDSDWYQERGWIPFGSETIYVIDAAGALLLPDPVGVRPMELADAEAIHALYQTHASRVDRSLEETRAMLQVPNMHAVVCERDGRIEGYAMMGRGEDLAQVIHEWSGAPDAVLPCVSQLWSLSRGENDRLYIMVPMTEADYQAYFQFVKAEGAQGILAMARLGNTQVMADVIRNISPDGVDAKAESASVVAVSGPGGEIRLTGYEILLALCPPRGDRRVTDVVEAQTGMAIPGMPMQPFVWGLDSI